jgi:hypothetical protein
MAMKKLGAILVLSALLCYSCTSSEGGAKIGDEPEQVQLPQIKVNLPPAPSFQKEHAPERYTDSAFSVYGPKGSKCKDCDKPHFFLSDRANGPKEEALMVTDYPKDDKDTKKKTTFDVGGQYYVTGTFAKSSATGFQNSDGLLVYKEAKKVGAE